MDSNGSIPEFKTEPLEAVPGIARTVRGTFSTHKTKDIKFRVTQLRKLYWALEDFGPKLVEALKKDLRRSSFESLLTEVYWVQNDCMFMADQVEKWAKDEKVSSPDVPLAFSMMGIRVKKEPMGAVLIFGAYNYPIQLLLSPFCGAIAAGCTAVLKPSEGSPNTAMVIKEMIESRLDPSAYRVVNGAVPESSALLNEKWDKIMYTGGAEVAKIIAKKAAETLTPLCLELGGRNPAVVTKNANLPLAARRLLFAKCLNAGQLCLSQNYILIDKDIVDSFIVQLKDVYGQFFPNGAQASPELCRIINQRHFLRIKKMLDDTKGKIVMGGKTDEAELYIEPTAVLVSSLDDSMIVQESFGPIFAIYPYNTLDEAINVINRIHRTPLVLSTFGSKAENARVLHETTSGGASINDQFFHATLNNVAFGGVGDSGWGAYRGRTTFDTFTHRRTVAEVPAWTEPLLRVRYMPYQWSELKRMRAFTAKKPNFDRSGRVVRGVGYWLGLVFSLGGKSAKGALMRWLLLFAVGYAAWYAGYLQKTPFAK